MGVLKCLRRVFGKKQRDSVACQAILTDSERISYSAREMRKTNNDLLCVYEHTQQGFEDVQEHLKKSEELVNKIAESFGKLENMVERACKMLCEEKEKLEKKRETLTKFREDVEDSKCRMSCLKESALEQHAKSAERTSNLMLSVRAEREDLEHRSSLADIAIQKYTVENAENEIVNQSAQLIRQRLQADHNSHVLQLQNECANFEKKTAVLRFQQKHLNTNQGKTDLLSNFRVPIEEQENTKQRFASIKKRKEALLDKLAEQKEKRRNLQFHNSRLRESIRKKKDAAMLGWA